MPIPPHVQKPHEGPHSADPLRPLSPEDFFEPLYYQSPSVHPHLLRTKKKADADALIGMLLHGPSIARHVSTLRYYRVTMLIAYLGWVDLDLGGSAILLGQ